MLNPSITFKNRILLVIPQGEREGEERSTMKEETLAVFLSRGIVHGKERF